MRKTVLKFGFFCALAAFAASAGYSIAQILQVAGILRWPLDEILIYAFSLAIAWPFTLAMLALHRSAPPQRTFWSGAGLLFAAAYSIYVSPLYVIQLGTALPLALRGTPDPLFAVSRYSLFWALDGMGYICMGIATLFAAASFDPAEKWTRRFFAANGLFTGVIIFIYFYPVFSIPLLMLGSPWMITAPGSILLLAAHFARQTALSGDSCAN